MNELTLAITPGTLPSGFCPASYQSVLNAFSAAQSVKFPSTLGGITVSGSKPADTTRAWFRLDTLGRPTQLYYFAQGSWLSMHPDISGKIIIWAGALPDFTTFDGGDSNPRGPSSGPMWQLANTALDGSGTAILAGQFPLGAGTLPSTKVITNGTTGGEESHVLTVPELPSATVPVTILNFPTGRFAASGAAVIPPPPYVVPNNDPDSTTSSGTLPIGGSDTPHNTMPPYYGVYFLQRTGRLFYSVS